MPFQIFMRTQVLNYSLRYLPGNRPKDSNHHVETGLTSKRANWLQSAFVDSVYALGGRCHGLEDWNPCPVSKSEPEKIIHVELTTGWFSGKMINYDSQAQAALMSFDGDQTQFHVCDRLHNSSQHPPSVMAQQGPAPGPHLSLAPPLLHLPPPLPPYPFRQSSQYMAQTQFGHMFHYSSPPGHLQVSDVLSWGCTTVATGLNHPDSGNWDSVYLDGSWDKRHSGSGAILVWPGGTTVGLAIRCPSFSSKNSEFWPFVQTIRYLQSVRVNGRVFFCVDNSRVVQNVDSYLSGNPPLPPSCTTQGTWHAVVHNLLSNDTFNVRIGWPKAKVSFPGTETADALAKDTSYALRVQLCHRQLPSLDSITFGGNPAMQPGEAHRRSLYPRHQHTGISTKTSFD